MEKNSKRTKDKRFIRKLIDRAMKIKSLSSAFGIRGGSGEERGFFFSPMVGWLSLDQDLLGLQL